MGYNTISDIFTKTGKLLHFNMLQEKGVYPSKYYRWMQILDAIPITWKINVRMFLSQGGDIISDRPINSGILVGKNWLDINKLTPRLFYSKLLEAMIENPTSIKNLEKYISDEEIDWEKVFLLPWKVTIESNLCLFQYKILNNILFLNDKLHKMNIVNNPRCTFCDTENETIVHFFCYCEKTRELWNEFTKWLADAIGLPDLNPQNALIDVCNNHLDKRMILMNHLILIFKKSLFEIRNRNLSPTIHFIKCRVKNIMKTEYKIAQYNKLDFHFKKWGVLTDKLNKL